MLIPERYHQFEEALSPDVIDAARAIANKIELNPTTADETYFTDTAVDVESRPQVFLTILKDTPEIAWQIVENMSEADYDNFTDFVMSPYPVEVCTMIIESLLISGNQGINIPLLFFSNENHLTILETLSQNLMDMLANQITPVMLREKIIARGLIDAFKKVGLGVFIQLTQQIPHNELLVFINNQILNHCQAEKLKQWLKEVIGTSVNQRRYHALSIVSPPEGCIDPEFCEIINEFTEYLEHVAPENRYDVFANKSGIYAEVTPQFFSYIFFQNRPIAYTILKNIRGQHRGFSTFIFTRISPQNKLYLLERALIENTQGDRRSRIELAEIMAYSGESGIVNELNVDCAYKLFVHIASDYFEIKNESTRADIHIGFERIVTDISLKKLKTILSSFKLKHYIQFFRTIPRCNEIINSIKKENKACISAPEIDYLEDYTDTIPRKDSEILFWLRQQNLSDPVTTIDIVQTLNLVVQKYLLDISSFTATIPPMGEDEQLDVRLREIITSFFQPFTSAEAVQRPAIWFEFYIKLQAFRLTAQAANSAIEGNNSEIVSDLLTVSKYLNNYYSKEIKEEILSRKGAVQIDAVFLPDGFQTITGRVKVITLKNLQSEADLDVFYRQFKYLKPSNLAIVTGFPADYASTGKAGAIITGALADRDQYETAHSYRRAVELGAPLAFFPNASEAFHYFDDQWITMYASDQKLYVRASTNDEIDKRINETKKTKPGKTISKFIPDIWPDIDIIDCRDTATNVSHQAGRKSAMLGKLIQTFPNETEPDSFTWSFAPYAKKRKFASVDETPQASYISNVLDSCDLSDHKDRTEAARKIYRSFMLNPLDITTSYFTSLWDKVVKTFGYSDTITQGFMARLTMNLEDRAEISAAGVYASLPVLPGTSKTKLAHLINELYTSMYSSKAIEIREMMKISHVDSYAAVLFERMPDWRNPVLSGSLIVNPNDTSGGFVMGHGHYLMDKGNRLSVLFSFSQKDDCNPLSAHHLQEYKKVPTNDPQAPYTLLRLAEEETDIVLSPEKRVHCQTINLLLKIIKEIPKRFGSELSWDMELTVEIGKDADRLRIHQLRPLVK